MSKVRMVKEGDPTMGELVASLKAEYLTPHEGEIEPLLMEVPDASRPQSIHLYVIWQDWAHFDAHERAQIIKQAYEAAYGTEQAKQVTALVGLTKVEADRMGIRYTAE